MTKLFLTFQVLHIEGGHHVFNVPFFLFIEIQKAKLSILNSKKNTHTKTQSKNITTKMLVAEGVQLFLISRSAYIFLIVYAHYHFNVCFQSSKSQGDLHGDLWSSFSV